MKNRHALPIAARTQQAKRRGAIAVLAAILMIPMMAMVAFAIDYGYLLKTRAVLQRAADAAALAAVRDLVPSDNVTQNLDTVRATVLEYAKANIAEITSFSVLDADIEIGRYDPKTVYTNFTILDTGILDTVRVTLRRDTQANSPVSLFFARVIGINTANVSATATAVLQKARFIPPGVGVLPFGIPKVAWTAASPGDIWTLYGNGVNSHGTDTGDNNRLLDDSNNAIPGNWGTLDIGSSSNSAEALRDQILNGLQQKDLNALHSEGKISQDTYIDSSQSWSGNGDPGLSSSIISACETVKGKTKLIPIYDSISGYPIVSGNNVEFHIVGWAMAEVVTAGGHGSKKAYVKIEKKSFLYDPFLKPQRDLSITDGVIEGAFTSPVLVQ